MPESSSKATASQKLVLKAKPMTHNHYHLDGNAITQALRRICALLPF